MRPTLATTYVRFLADAAHLDRLRPHTLRAYRYELAAAAADSSFDGPLEALQVGALEAWLARRPAAPSTVGRRAATFNRFFRFPCGSRTSATPASGEAIRRPITEPSTAWPGSGSIRP